MTNKTKKGSSAASAATVRNDETCKSERLCSIDEKIMPEAIVPAVETNGPSADEEKGIAQITDEPITKPGVSLDCIFRSSGRQFINKPTYEIMQEAMNEPLHMQYWIYCLENGVKGFEKDINKVYELLDYLNTEIGPYYLIDNRLALYIFNGWGCEHKDEEAAYDLWARAMCECKKDLEDKSKRGDEFYLASLHESLYNSTYAVGYCTLYGLGTETNARKAVSLFLECARIDVNTDDLPFYVEGGWKPFQRQAYNAVINIYTQGIGVPRDDSKAFYYRKLICDMGIGTSQDYINLAACYQRGIGVDKDLAEGFKYLKKAADMNNNVATDLVADCLCHGIGVAKNSEEAQKYNLRGIAIVQDNPWEIE